MFNYPVYLLALDKEGKDEVGRRYSEPKVNGSVIDKILPLLDFVFHYKVVESENGMQRVLQTSATPDVKCKDRSSKLAKFELPDLGKIGEKIC